MEMHFGIVVGAMIFCSLVGICFFAQVIGYEIWIRGTRAYRLVKAAKKRRSLSSAGRRDSELHEGAKNAS